MMHCKQMKPISSANNTQQKGQQIKKKTQQRATNKNNTQQRATNRNKTQQRATKKNTQQKGQQHDLKVSQSRPWLCI